MALSGLNTRKVLRGYLNILFPWGKVPMEIRVVMLGSSAEKVGIREDDILPI